MKLTKEQKEFLTNRKTELEEGQSCGWIIGWFFLNILLTLLIFPMLGILVSIFLTPTLWILYFIAIISFAINHSRRDKEIKEIEYKLLEK